MRTISWQSIINMTKKKNYKKYTYVKPFTCVFFPLGIPCKNLPAPINGAMSCDIWMYGRQCQMQCSKKYDIPAVGSGFTGIFTCSEKEGVFKPLNTVPNCTGKNL